jgi:[acyl-carrier-protein] S-malonyltransferase
VTARVGVLCPGQGSQRPGFLQPWLQVPAVRAHVERLGEACGRDLVALGTTAGERELRDTAAVQPLIVAAGLAAWAELVARGTPGWGPPSAVAGHSVGEVTAARIAGVLGTADAMALVSARGEAMASASAAARTGMSAVVGGDAHEVAAALAALGLTAASHNGSGQVVAAGDLDALGELAARRPAGARVVPLPVAGAFHTAAMAGAAATLADHATRSAAHDPWLPVLSNLAGDVVCDGRQLLLRLVRQVSEPVRWDLCLARLRRMRLDAVVELPPAGVLAGIARRELPGVATVALRSPEDLEAARALGNGTPTPR